MIIRADIGTQSLKVVVFAVDTSRIGAASELGSGFKWRTTAFSS